MRVTKYCRESEQLNKIEHHVPKLCLNIPDYDISVDAEYGDEDNLLLDLFKSILSVSEEYLFVNSRPSQHHTERVFAYELYRQWANRIQINYHGNLILNGEIGKETKLFDSIANEGYRFPDLVLHHSQNDTNYQGVICEIKTSIVGVTDFEEDINKLKHFVCGDTKKRIFKFGVFILVGSPINKIIHLMDRMDSHYDKVTQKCRLSNIICVAYNHGELETIRYDWLLDKLTREKLKNHIK
ncbi:MAG: hypothetical protein IJV17_05490 [Prevotella sp.]|nr:hypothetical protein [Prevotella sp.]